MSCPNAGARDLSAALFAADTNATVTVWPGVYIAGRFDQIPFDGVTLQGTSQENVILTLSGGLYDSGLSNERFSTLSVTGDDVTIREHAPINPGTEGGGMLPTIGDRCLIMLGAHVEIVKAEIGRAQQAEHLKRRVGLLLAKLERIGRKPGPVKRLTAEGVGPGPDEIVPVAHGKPQMILHPLTHHDLVRVIVPEGERGFRVAVGLNGNGVDTGEIIRAHDRAAFILG